MTNIAQRLSALEKQRVPTAETEFDRHLRARINAGRGRAQAAREARGLSSVSQGEPVLPPIPAVTFRGMTRTQIQIYILHRGRERNHLRRLAEKETKPCTKKP
jgi:hypothetical protein